MARALKTLKKETGWDIQGSGKKGAITVKKQVQKGLILGVGSESRLHIENLATKVEKSKKKYGIKAYQIAEKGGVSSSVMTRLKKRDSTLEDATLAKVDEGLKRILEKIL